MTERFTPAALRFKIQQAKAAGKDASKWEALLKAAPNPAAERRKALKEVPHHGGKPKGATPAKAAAIQARKPVHVPNAGTLHVPPGYKVEIVGGGGNGDKRQLGTVHTLGQKGELIRGVPTAPPPAAPAPVGPAVGALSQPVSKLALGTVKPLPATHNHTLKPGDRHPRPWKVSGGPDDGILSWIIKDAKGYAVAAMPFVYSNQQTLRAEADLIVELVNGRKA